MLEFEFKDPADGGMVVKATVHKNGRIGFSMGAKNLLGLDEEDKRYFKIATNKANPEDKNIYMVRASKSDSGVFKVGKAGDYFYLKIKHVLDGLDYDYENDRIIFDIKEVKQGDMTYYQLKNRKPVGKS